MLPRDTNERGTIFGGVILSHLDLAGAVEASHHTENKLVTVAMDKIDFIAPVHVGNVVSFYTRTTRIGRTSIQVHVDVFAARRGPDEGSAGEWPTIRVEWTAPRVTSGMRRSSRCWRRLAGRSLS